MRCSSAACCGKPRWVSQLKRVSQRGTRCTYSGILALAFVVQYCMYCMYCMHARHNFFSKRRELSRREFISSTARARARETRSSIAACMHA